MELHSVKAGQESLSMWMMQIGWKRREKRAEKRNATDTTGFSVPSPQPCSTPQSLLAAIQHERAGRAASARTSAMRKSKTEVDRKRPNLGLLPKESLILGGSFARRYDCGTRRQAHRRYAVPRVGVWEDLVCIDRRDGRP